MHKNKSTIIRHIYSFFIAVLLVILTVFLFKNIIKNELINSIIDKNKNITINNKTFDFIHQDNYEANVTLVSNTMEKYLSNGDIVIFGSSELGRMDQKFSPENFFNNELNISIHTFGHAGQQTLSIMAQLAMYLNPKTKKNAKLVIMLSPIWFQRTGYLESTGGTKLSSFLEFMPKELLYKLYFRSKIDERFKIWISDYLRSKFFKFKKASAIYYYAMGYSLNNIIDLIYNPYSKAKKFIKEIPQPINKNFMIKSIKIPDWNAYEKKAILLENSKSTNNRFGINNDYFIKHIKVLINNNDFPIKIKRVPTEKNSKEYADFLMLVEVCKLYNIKPYFIIQPINPLGYIGMDGYNPILTSIKKTLSKNGFKYLDMWTSDKTKYNKATLTDMSHPGEYGWIKINKAIYNYFIKDQKNEK